MALPIHIFFALLSICFTSFVVFAPSQKRLRITYLFVAGTVISGVALGVEKGMNMAQACLSGAFYLGFIITTVLIARKKLATTQK